MERKATKTAAKDARSLEEYADYISRELLQRAFKRISSEEADLVKATFPDLRMGIVESPRVNGYAVAQPEAQPTISLKYPVSKYGMSDRIPGYDPPFTPENIATHEMQHFADVATRVGDISGYWEKLARRIFSDPEYPAMTRAHGLLANIARKTPQFSWFGALSPEYEYDPEMATEYTASLAEHNWKPTRMPAMKAPWNPENIRDTLQGIALYLTQGP